MDLTLLYSDTRAKSQRIGAESVETAKFLYTPKQDAESSGSNLYFTACNTVKHVICAAFLPSSHRAESL
jgi:hypothetical protein